MALDEDDVRRAVARARRRRRSGARGVPDQRRGEPRARTARCRRSSSRSIPAHRSARSRCCSRTSWRAARASTCAARRRSSTRFCTDACTTRCQSSSSTSAKHGYTQPMLVIHNSGGHGAAQLDRCAADDPLRPGRRDQASEHLADAGRARQRDRDRHGRHQLRHRAGRRRVGSSITTSLPTIDRWLVSVPMIHLVTLGAGGGSIARYNRLLPVGPDRPESAGSDPGPACYDRGGMRPTVTDADLLLGLPGSRPVCRAAGSRSTSRRAESAIEEEFCRPPRP